jgi:hypothetical protein
MKALIVSLAVLAAAASPAPSWRDAVTSFAQQHFRNPAWGYSHNRRDYELARRLAAADGVTLDDDVLFAAAYLHDQAAFPPWEDTKRDHSDVAAELVPAFLKQAGFPPAKIAAVQAAVRTHMYYRKGESAEARYLHDADALDWLGAIGVARVIALVDANGGQPDGPAMIKMLEDNLRDVPAAVTTPAGRALLPARQAELAAFLADLKRETDGLKDL